jgi:nitrile hydratase alpha subunit
VRPNKHGGIERWLAKDTWKNWSQLVTKVWADDKLKERLLASPAAVLREYGIEIPAGMEARVVENTDKVYYLTLPAKPVGDATELTSGELSSVAAGATIGAGIFSTSLLGSRLTAAEPTGPPHTGAKGDPYEDRD